MLAPAAMKYGLITNVMTFGHLTSGSRSNLGDDIQTHAVEHLYASMGIAPAGCAASMSLWSSALSRP